MMSELIDYIGFGNVLSILLFIIGTLFAFYLYFRTFFRLTYSIVRICENCENINNWTNEEQIFVSRILIYNNGRKTLTNKDVNDLEVSTSLKTIDSIRVIKGNEHLKVVTKGEKIALNFKYMDSGDSFVLEAKHRGQILINGRVSETGKILETEPKAWLWFNVVAIIVILTLMIYSLVSLIYGGKSILIPTIINFLLLAGIYFLIRFLHGMFFIPDSIAAKYLECKDKARKAFLNGFNVQ